MVPDKYVGSNDARAERLYNARSSRCPSDASRCGWMHQSLTSGMHDAHHLPRSGHVTARAQFYSRARQQELLHLLRLVQVFVAKAYQSSPQRSQGALPAAWSTHLETPHTTGFRLLELEIAWLVFHQEAFLAF